MKKCRCITNQIEEKINEQKIFTERTDSLFKLFYPWCRISILGQAVIKEALAASWGVEAMAITAISAALGLGRLIALPFAGPLSDKLGRRISTAIGSGSYAIYLIGLALAFNAGTNGGYQIAYICAIVGGIANSFLCLLYTSPSPRDRG